MSLTLVLGGARSGKSRFAESLARNPKTYIATAQAFDDEMHARIALHRKQRGDGWVNIEEPIELLSAMHGLKGFVLIDCLTLWLSNLLIAELPWREKLGDLLPELAQSKADVVIVSNEVGQGIVPDTALGRAFRDAQGIANQQIAAMADSVVMLVAGIPLAIKGPLPTVPRPLQE